MHTVKQPSVLYAKAFAYGKMNNERNKKKQKKNIKN